MANGLPDPEFAVPRPKTRTNVPRSVRIQIAGQAMTDPRTVDRYLFTRDPMTGVAEAAIRRVLQTMNYPDPRAVQARA